MPLKVIKPSTKIVKKKTSRKPKKTSRKPKKVNRKPKMKSTMEELTEYVVAGSRTKPGVLGQFLDPEDVKNVVLIDKQFYDLFKKKFVKNKQLKQIIKKAENLNIILPPPSLRRHVKLSTGLFPEEVQQKIAGSWIYGTRINDSTYIVHLPFEPYETVKLRINADGTSTIIHASYNTQF